MQNAEPRYAIAAADHTLRLVLLLLERREIRIVDAAEELGVARSTAHRLMQMLVYRGFAVRRPDHSYGVGTALLTVPTDVAMVRSWLRPAMDEVHRRTGETVHLMVREGTEAVFLESLESSHQLRVGSRAGMRLPADVASGGLALLAVLPTDRLRSLYARRDEVDLTGLERRLRRVRLHGYGLNVEGSEPGICAVGVAVVGTDGEAIAAVAVSAPTVRLPRTAAGGVATVVREVLADAGVNAP